MASTTRVYPSARGKIIEAAERVLLRDGVGAFSVDAVVAEAGVSKGGFFYHFKTKDDLLAELIAELHAQMATDVAALAARDTEARGRTLRARVRRGVDRDQARGDRTRALIRALIAASVESPHLLARMKDVNAQQLAEAPDGIPPAQVLLVHLAMDGLWLGEALGTLALSRAATEGLKRLMLELTRHDVAAPPAKGAGKRRKEKKP
jgi:AcrR family transcriptional regulator